MNNFLTDKSDIETALVKLRQLDPKLISVIETAGDIPLRRTAPGFEGLAKIITSQLISKTAADTIWQRICDHYGNLSHDIILQSDEQILKQLGLSGAKARTLFSIATILKNQPDFLKQLEKLDSKQAAKQLTSIKGIGPWTAEVYLMFCLGHWDIFPSGDIALRNAAGSLFYNGVRPEEKKLRQLASRWAPYRSVAARVLWQYYAVELNRDTNPI